MSFHLIGGRGRLGQALAYEYRDSDIRSLPRNVYQEWSMPGKSDQVARYFERNALQGDVVFVASGLLDPRLSEDMLHGVNFHLPKNVIDGATKIGVKVITFGTIMEDLLESPNHYVRSKKSLAEYAGNAIQKGSSVIHMRIHTLYGAGRPSPFMFLGQIQAAVLNNQLFKMTSGNQLREYHHLDDEAKAIRQLESLFEPGLVNLSHGKPQTLCSIATGVFSALGKSHLLQIGALPEPIEENYSNVFSITPHLEHLTFREPMPAIVKYMQQCCMIQD